MTKKELYLLFTICILPLFSFAQELEKEIAAPIEEVRIHLQGAEIIRTAKTTLSKGKHKLVFTDLSPKINPASIQISTDGGDVNILSTTNRVNFLKEQNKSNSKIRLLQDSMEIAIDVIQNISDQEVAIMQEKKMLENNQIISGKEKAVDLQQLKATAAYYRQRFLEIYQDLSKLRKEKATIQLRKNNIQNQLKELNVVKRPSSEIYLSINNTQEQTIEFRLRYVVKDAGWSPIYDLTVTDLKNPINIKYRALAFNHTGVDWDNIKVTLSTADPNQNATLPILSPWYILEDRPQVISYSQGRLNSIVQNQNAYSKNEKRAKDNTLLNGNNFVFQEIEISELSNDFKIDEIYSIPADRKPYSITISETEKEASYQHYSVPKMDKDAFLLGQIVGWEDMDLMPGPMNIYYEKNFIGMAHLDIRNLSDTLDLSLGRDSKVLVKRTKVKELTKKQFLQSKKKLDLTYKVTVKNNRNQTIDMDLLDQIPISQLKEINVEVNDISGAEYFENTGKLRWKMKLQPGESKTVIFSFSITYPKGKEIRIDRSRKMVAPRYY